MPKKKSDSAILAEIREVVRDFNKPEFYIRCHRKSQVVNVGDTDRLDADLAMAIIEDLVKSKASSLTNDYRKTKADGKKAARKVGVATPAP